MSTSVEVHLDLEGRNHVVGRLLDSDRGIHFQYAPAFLDTGLELSPFKLPLAPGVSSVGIPEFHSLPGLFHDSLPDGWGLLLMHRRMRMVGLDPERISVLRWLTHLGARAMGALVFHPLDEGLIASPAELNLKTLETEAQRVFSGRATKVLPELELAGGSPGGARPKVVVGLGPDDEVLAGAHDLPSGFQHWLIKFTAKPDPSDMGPLEEAYAVLARKAGIEVMPTRVFAIDRQRRVFATQRFDRVGNRRLHLHTIGGLLHASHRLPSLDYKSVIAATIALTKDRSQGFEVFRRAAFNVLFSNRDDHAHNCSYLMNGRGEWSLSPAYDLTPSSGPGGHHSTSIMGQSLRPTRQHLIDLAASADFKRSDAEAALKKVERAVDAFPKVAKEVGVSATTMKWVQKQLDAVRRDYA